MTIRVCTYGNVCLWRFKYCHDFANQKSPVQIIDIIFVFLLLKKKTQKVTFIYNRQCLPQRQVVSSKCLKQIIQLENNIVKNMIFLQ